MAHSCCICGGKCRKSAQSVPKPASYPERKEHPPVRVLLPVQHPQLDGVNASLLGDFHLVGVIVGGKAPQRPATPAAPGPASTRNSFFISQQRRTWIMSTYAIKAPEEAEVGRGPVRRETSGSLYLQPVPFGDAFRRV